MGKIISLANKKGGVGKTTTAVNLAAYCADLGKKVLLVDVDSQGNATTGFGFSKSALKKSVYNVLIEDDSAENNILPTQIKLLDILPANVDLTGAEVELVHKRDREKILKNALDKIRNNYDYIFIDCPPSLGLITINAWVASDSILIPLQSEYYAMDGISQLMNTIAMVRQHSNPKLVTEGVVITMYDGRALIAKQITAEIKRFFKNKLYEIIIPRNVRLAEAPSHGMPILLYDPKCAGARAYKALAEEFLSKQK
ncbi:MAG: ParA family protein [Clostridiales bacterium]|nr:ParA family protein [Clostridiales bacterium]